MILSPTTPIDSHQPTCFTRLLLSAGSQENINNFLAGCRTIGVPDTDLFMTVDLYEAKNMTQVVQVRV